MAKKSTPKPNPKSTPKSTPKNKTAPNVKSASSRSAKAAQSGVKNTRSPETAASASSSSSDRYDVIIVGAGPVGLALAKGLAMDGRRILLLEKKPELSQHSKAVTIWAGTQDVIERLGLLEKFEERALCKDEIRIWDADENKPMADLPLFELSTETAHARLLLLPQSATEEIFFEGLSDESSATVLFEANVTSLNDDGTGVTVSYVKDGREVAAQARFAIGCDGAHSVVRAALGFHLEGETYSIKAGLADIILGDRSREYEFPRFSTSDGLALAIKCSPELWRLIFIDRVSREWDLQELTEETVPRMFGQKDFKLVWTSEFKLHRRTSEKFGRGNMVLAGDAAHLNSPIGGQGMNSGIQDTEVLRQALAAAFEADSCQPLEEYADQRKRQVERGVNRYTGFMTNLMFSGHTNSVKGVLKTIGAIIKVPPIRHAFLRRAMMLNPFNPHSPSHQL